MAATWVFVVRHGETFWNKDKRLQGQTDSLLNAKGKAQARAAAKWFAEFGAAPSPDSDDQHPPRATPFAAIYSSDLTRAVWTAQPIADALGEWVGCGWACSCV